MKPFTLATFVTLTVALGGCGDDDARNPGVGAPAATPAAAPKAQGGSDDHPNRVTLGEQSKGGLKLVAMQDEPVKPGGEGAFDLVITGGKPKAVRFWVGTEAGEESVKAKAVEETPDNWHVHVEVPDPLPAGSKFWAEVEPATGEKFNVSFDLKAQ